MGQTKSEGAALLRPPHVRLRLCELTYAPPIRNHELESRVDQEVKRILSVDLSGVALVTEVLRRDDHLVVLRVQEVDSRSTPVREDVLRTLEGQYLKACVSLVRIDEVLYGLEL